MAGLSAGIEASHTATTVSSSLHSELSSDIGGVTAGRSRDQIAGITRMARFKGVSP